MVEQRSHYIASDVLANAAALRADLLRTAQRTAQLMCEIALTRENVAAHYRQPITSFTSDRVRSSTSGQYQHGR